MQKVKLLGLVLVAAAFMACQKESPSPEEASIPKCESPKYQVLFDTSKISGTQELYGVQDFKALLGKTLQDSQCFSFAQTPSEETWEMVVSYRLETSAQSQDFNIAKGQSEATLKSLLILDLIRAKQTVKERASGELKLSKDHYFGTGKESEISKNEIERLLKQNLAFIIEDLKSK